MGNQDTLSKSLGHADARSSRPWVQPMGELVNLLAIDNLLLT